MGNNSPKLSTIYEFKIEEKIVKIHKLKMGKISSKLLKNPVKLSKIRKLRTEKKIAKITRKSSSKWIRNCPIATFMSKIAKTQINFTSNFKRFR